MEKLLDVKDITKVLGKIILFRKFSFHLKSGEMLAICGESGSGKTTLLNIISMLEDVDAGDVIFKGNKLIFSEKKKNAYIRNKDIGYVFQDYKLINEMNILENIGLPMMIAGKSKWEKRAQKLVKVFHMEKFLHIPVSKLSGGQKQRIAIARALIMDPQLILADEPTGALDKKNKEMVLKILIELKNRGKGIIIVTHDEDVADYCDRKISLI